MQLNQCKRCLQWEKEAKSHVFGMGTLEYKLFELNEEGICPGCVTDLNKIAYDKLELIEDDGLAIRVGAHRVDTLIAIDCRLDRFSEMMEKREFINLVNEVGHMFADFKETLIREVERVRPGLCECSGATFECEHWGAHETVDKIISIIEK